MEVLDYVKRAKTLLTCYETDEALKVLAKLERKLREMPYTKRVLELQRTLQEVSICLRSGTVREVAYAWELLERIEMRIKAF